MFSRFALAVHGSVMKRSARLIPLVTVPGGTNVRLFSSWKTDEEIAQTADMQNIGDVASERLGMCHDDLFMYGPYKAKIKVDKVMQLQKQEDRGKLILVTAMSPTKAGEGKTCTSVGLADGLAHIGKNTMVALREPSLGPVFGVKGGAAGGGFAQIVPMDDINLHFTGDLHAIGTAHNLLAAMVDNHIHHRNEPHIDVRRVNLKRVLDMNDRALRSTIVGLGGPLNGYPREDGFDITVASEVMAIFCLAQNLTDLNERLGKIIVGYRETGKLSERTPITCADINAQGAMTALLRDALQPNLVQTLEHNPAFVHGGPFANIAHGCSSVIATRMALKLSDYVVTEAGFGADLGAEKFFNIKCRKAGLKPAAAVIVATVRALKLHGGLSENDTLKGVEDAEAVEKGLPNLLRHIDNVRKFKVPVVVALNKFPLDTDEEVEVVMRECQKKGVKVVLSDHWAKGGAGAADLAKEVVSTVENEPSDFTPLYEDEMPLVGQHAANSARSNACVPSVFFHLTATAAITSSNESIPPAG
eukprot:INCI5094.12.p1 GENE.INCI5094.12~~INCI5094.12.p1  ORF type:complete len:530 (+),score=100.12 INCI5094.12:217-1806(+)